MRRRLFALSRLLCTFALLVGLAFSVTLTAQKTVHVREYTKKDGTVVAAHERAAPTSAPATHPATAATPAPTTTTPAVTPTTTKRSSYCETCPRDQYGRILRSGTAKALFQRLTGYPNGRPGYVVDHIIPLACGGPDMPTNMQWQTLAASKAKDKEERKDCH